MPLALAKRGTFATRPTARLNRTQRDQNSIKAELRWRDARQSEKHQPMSRVFGIAERIRSALTPLPFRTSEERRQEQDEHRDSQRRARVRAQRETADAILHAKAMGRVPPPFSRSKYQPNVCRAKGKR